jgi:hypothetical protein
MISPNLDPRKASASSAPLSFWRRLAQDEALRHVDPLEKLLAGCEIIAALDGVDLLAA